MAPQCVSVQEGEIQTSNVSLASEETRSPLSGLHLLSKMPAVGRAGLPASAGLPRGVEGNMATRREMLLGYFWDTTAEFTT